VKTFTDSMALMVVVVVWPMLRLFQEGP